MIQFLNIKNEYVYAPRPYYYQQVTNYCSPCSLDVAQRNQGLFKTRGFKDSDGLFCCE